MDGGNLENNHDNFDGGSGNRLSAESLPLIDTRLLSPSELRALSHSSSLSASSSASLAASAGGNDEITLKIDRSVFNESAGSKKQTYLRLRLGRQPQQPSPPSPQRQRHESSREEQTQIALLLRSLFSVDSIQGKAEEDEGEEEEEVEGIEGQTPFSFPIHYNGNDYQKPNLDLVQNVLTQGISGNETKRRRGRPRKIRNPSDETEVLDISLTGEASVYASVDKTSSKLGTDSRFSGSGISMDSNSGKRKRGRPPKNRDGLNQSEMKYQSEDKEELVDLENKEGTMVDHSALDKEELVNLENREGTRVDLSALANDDSEDPYGEELRRITVGLETKEEILGFLEQLNGEWVNIGKKKKVVNACDYGGYLPRGWKLMLYIKKKGVNLWLACRRYISPDGQQFETCKEVSTYLQSLLESQSKNRLYSLQSDYKTLGQQPVIANKSLVGNSDSKDLPVLSSETNQNLESRRTDSDLADPVKTNVGEKDDNGDFLNGHKGDDMKKIDDDNMENLVALPNSEAQYGEKMMKMLQNNQNMF
ncbi:Methyl-CpG-binding domain-containing protein 8 [Cardamine amara subsp. amara]|uniref:Methyl-CpG-binding domain-containing protein 8 n=1 Tax=Cardamine amara subsp. amara TaxID=228776 RepID=A0ABD1C8K9_CARAN